MRVIRIITVIMVDRVMRIMRVNENEIRTYYEDEMCEFSSLILKTRRADYHDYL
jgi:hypothetical protein